MENIMVSVLCLCYNHENYIKDALEGFVKQKTTFPFEVLIHDDASTDKSAEIIREYEAKYPDIIKPTYQTENQYSKGIKIMRTHLLPKIRGKYIAFCEGDDFWTDENKLQKQVDFLEANPEYTVCAHNTILCDMTTNEEKVFFPTGSREIKLEEVLLGPIYHLSSVLVKTDFYLATRPAWMNMLPGVGDFPNVIYYSISGRVMYLGDEVMSYYRYGTPGSWTNRVEKIYSKRIALNWKIMKMLRAVDKYYDYQYHQAIRKAILKYLCLQLRIVILYCLSHCPERFVTWLRRMKQTIEKRRK